MTWSTALYFQIAEVAVQFNLLIFTLNHEASGAPVGTAKPARIITDLVNE